MCWTVKHGLKILRAALGVRARQQGRVNEGRGAACVKSYAPPHPPRIIRFMRHRFSHEQARWRSANHKPKHRKRRGIYEKQITMFLAVAKLAVGMMAGCPGEKPRPTCPTPPGRSVRDTPRRKPLRGTPPPPRPRRNRLSSDAAAPEQTAGENTGVDRRGAGTGGRFYSGGQPEIAHMREELDPITQEQNPGVGLVGTYDSSGKAPDPDRRRLEADVFMSAAPKQMKACWMKKA